MTEQQAHHDRDHATWSASATERNWRCAGAIAMESISPEDKESLHAARGTAAHEVAEWALRSGGECFARLGDKVATKEHDIEVDEEITNSAQEYVDYCRGLSGDERIEEKFSLAAISPPFEAGGTCDFICVETAQIEVVDLKHGMGVVDVNENKQLRTYALLAMLNVPEAANVDKIKVTIVQPRAPHKDGRIRSETFHVADLVEWTSELMKAMRRSKRAFDDFQKIGGTREGFDVWAEAWLTPGACKFCRAEANCPALRKKALAVISEKAAGWFEDPNATVVVPSPAEMTPETFGRVLDGLDMLEDWIKAVRGHAHAQAERGVTIPGYQLVDKIGNRVWKDEEVALVGMRRAGIITDKLWAPKKLISPAQADKMLGKRKGEIEDLWEKPVTGTNLASVAKSTRPAAKTTIEKNFEPVEKEN
jgi:hypothetical protein